MQFIRKYARIVALSLLRFFRGGYTQRATALTYYTLFAVVPVVALLFGIAKGFNLESLLKREIAENFSQHREFVAWVYRFADTTLHQASGGVVAGVGVIALFWTVIMLAANVESAFNAVWQLPNRRSMFRKAGDYLAVLLITPIILIVVGSGSMVLKSFLGRLVWSVPSLRETGLTLLFLITSAAPVLVTCALFTGIYCLVPNTRVRFRAALTGGVIAGVAFHGLQSGFIFIQLALSKYNAVYGSFAVLPLFLFWLRCSWMIALLGAELAYVQQHIDLGYFERNDLPPAPRFRRQAQLAMLLLAVRAFCDGKPPPTVTDLAEELRLTEARARELVGELLRCGLLRATQSPGEQLAGLIPGVPPEELTVALAEERLESFGSQPATAAAVPELKTVAKLCAGLDHARRKAHDNRLLKEL